METTELTFTSQNGVYECKLAEEQLMGVIQIQAPSQRAIVSAAVVILANLPGMEPSVIRIVENSFGDSVIFSVDFQAGCEVTLRTSTKPIKAVWMKSE